MRLHEGSEAELRTFCTTTPISSVMESAGSKATDEAEYKNKTIRSAFMDAMGFLRNEKCVKSTVQGSGFVENTRVRSQTKVVSFEMGEV